MKKYTFIALLALIITSCTGVKENKHITDYVNPFIGTGGHGHTYPGATSPFGMVQLSPDTRLTGWDGCSGYHYTDDTIYGFSHTHLSGTGISDYGDVLLMPISGKAVYQNTEYCSPFSHQNETAKAGYYRVKLDKFNILAELTTSPRTGMHRYTFSQEKNNKIVLDLNHRDKVLDAYIHQVSKNAIEGYRISQAWAQKQYCYFYMEFSQDIDHLNIASNDSVFAANKLQSTDIVASIEFNEIKNKTLLVKVGISAVDMAGAKANLQAENPDWDFDKLKEENRNSWEKELGKINITDPDEHKKTTFYTALYHNLIVPNLFSDVDGRYRGMDMKIHKSQTGQYTVFSLWDTYRATHPLYSIIETKRTNDFIHTFKNQYKDGGILPIWELSANYTGCMIGYHAIPVITDAFLKGETDIDAGTLLKMMLTSANQDKLGLKAYKKKGYISILDDSESVSKTLEYAYDDWCIAQVAKSAGNDSIYRVFIQRAQSYKNILDPSIGYMRPKLNETWKEPFDPREVDFNYTEANSWQYSFYVPQDMYSFRDMIGGNEQFEKQLDHLFTAPTETTGREQSDITGLIGQYAHGNEPSHHMAYLFDYVNKPGKTQKYVQQIIDKFYTDRPDGLCGNEDCGQMSAWYVFSTMGFYPVNPANGEYVFGKPQFDQVTINLENGNQFIIEKTGDQSPDAMVKEVELNGEKYTKAYITHADIMKGGNLRFVMSKDDVISFAEADLPHSKITDHLIVPLPAIRGAKRVFTDSTTVKMEAVEGAKILYSLNDSEEKEYTKPIVIHANSKIRFKAVKDGKESKTLEADFYQIPKGRTIRIKNKWHSQYDAGGNNALIDGITGGENFRTGAWQGYYYDDLEAVVNLGKPMKMTALEINFIQDARSWIWMPEYVEFWGSNDGKYFFPLGKDVNDVDKMDDKVQIKTFRTEFYPKKIKYVKIFAKNHNICPKGHPGEGEKAFIFADEIKFIEK